MSAGAGPADPWHPGPVENRPRRPTSGVAAERPEPGPPRRAGRPPRSGQERAKHRARLLDGAMAAIKSRGPDISIDDLAIAIGCSKPVLYDEFGGKLGIADAIAARLAETVEHEVVARLAAVPGVDADTAVRVTVTVLIELVRNEPNLHAFLVRSMRSQDRGFLDNALVREMHARAALIINLISPTIDQSVLPVLIDGAFGFMFAAIESWQRRGEPSEDELIARLSAAIVTGLRAAGDDVGDQPERLSS